MATPTKRLSHDTRSLAPVMEAISEIRKNQEDDRKTRDEREMQRGAAIATLVSDVGQIKTDLVEIKTSAKEDRDEIKKITVIELTIKNMEDWKKHQEDFKVWVSRTFWGVLIVGIASIILLAVCFILRVPYPGGYQNPAYDPQLQQQQVAPQAPPYYYYPQQSPPVAPPQAPVRTH